MYVLLVNNVVTAASPIPQVGIPGMVQVADNDSRYLAFINPPTSAAAILAPKLAAGVALSCAGNSNLNATYALDPTSTAQIFQIGTFVTQFNIFPNGTTTLDYPDASGTQHAFNATQFVEFLRAVAQLVFELQTQAGIASHGGTPSWPSQSLTIS